MSVQMSDLLETVGLIACCFLLAKGKRSEHSKDLLDKVADGETKVDPAGDKSGVR